MGKSEEDQRDARIELLEHKVALLEAQRCLNDDADEALEAALRDRLSLVETLGQLLPILVSHLGARAAFIRTFDEALELRCFHYDTEGENTLDAWPFHPEAIAEERGDRYFLTYRQPDSVVIAQRVDVAGEDFGTAAVWFCEPRPESDIAASRILLDTWCEELDNHLAAISLSRFKAKTIEDMSEALKEPVLDVGVRRGIDVLQQKMGFDDLLLVFRSCSGSDPSHETLRYKVIIDGELRYDSNRSQSTPELLADLNRWYRDGDWSAFSHFGLCNCCEELMIQGVRDQQMVGRLLVSRREGRDFNTFDRDLVERFADFLRMRIVDFNREWKQLSLCFPPAIVARLLAEEGYQRRYLVPQEHEVAILYSDLVSFTKMSEQILKHPESIGRVIDLWGDAVVQIIWETGGVFDKMVGDCVIGLWGPPFHELDAKSLCHDALAAARRIQQRTRELARDERLPMLHHLEQPLAVSTALHFCPLLVGQFGPNENYTGFSSGMNNAARLQGVAQRDEILCMDSFVEAIDEAEWFSEVRTSRVKNVGNPIRFHSLVM